MANPNTGFRVYLLNGTWIDISAVKYDTKQSSSDSPLPARYVFILDSSSETDAIVDSSQVVAIVPFNQSEGHGSVIRS